MPSRLLREGILDSEAVNSLTPPEEVFYRRLMSVVDDFGRFDGRPSVLRSRLYPLKIDDVREADISRWIAAAVKAGLIALYSHDSKPYILFGKLGSPRNAKSKFPDPPPDVQRAIENSCFQLKTDANDCTQLKTSVPGSGSGSGTGSGTGKDRCSEPPLAASEQAVSSHDPPLMTFPTVGKDAAPWPLTRAQVDSWHQAFPGVAVLAECRKALAWCEANPAKQKTPRGMPKFLFGWLERSQNSAGGRGPPPPRQTPGERAADAQAKLWAEVHAMPPPPE